jgi:hypothetical protein
MENIKRESRDSKISPEAYLKPFDVTKFGGEEDPCFGKEYDLTAPECGICGDIEACSIAFMHNTTRVRTQLEAENKYKDLEEADMIRKKRIRDFVKSKRMKGWGDTRIITVLKRRYSLTRAAAHNFL